MKFLPVQAIRAVSISALPSAAIWDILHLRQRHTKEIKLRQSIWKKIVAAAAAAIVAMTLIGMGILTIKPLYQLILGNTVSQHTHII